MRRSWAAAARGPAAGGVDRPARGPAAAGAAAPPGPAGAAADPAAHRIHAVLADHGHDRPAGAGAGPAGPGWPRSSCPRSPAKWWTTTWRSSTPWKPVTGRLDWEIHQRPGPTRGSGAHPAAGGGPVHRGWSSWPRWAMSAGSAGAQSWRPGWAHPDRARQRPRRPLRAHLQAGLGVLRWVPVRGGADRQAVPAVRRRLPGHRHTAGKKIATTAVARKLLTRACTAHRRRAWPQPHNPPQHPRPRRDAVTDQEEVARPRASSKNTLSRATARSEDPDWTARVPDDTVMAPRGRPNGGCETLPDRAATRGTT